MGFGHLFVSAAQDAVLAALDRHLAARGFERFEMTCEAHPTRTREIHETRMRLYWVSPRIGKWTSIHEHRYYINTTRRRWGYTDEELGLDLSRDPGGDVWRIEVADQAAFWLYAHCRDGKEVEGSAYHDDPPQLTADRSHPRYALNHIVEREGFPNLGLSYEEIPGPMVRQVERIPQSREGIVGFEEFVHRAYRNPGVEVDSDQ